MICCIVSYKCYKLGVVRNTYWFTHLYREVSLCVFLCFDELVLEYILSCHLFSIRENYRIELFVTFPPINASIIATVTGKIRSSTIIYDLLVFCNALYNPKTPEKKLGVIHKYYHHHHIKTYRDIYKFLALTH